MGDEKKSTNYMQVNKNVTRIYGKPRLRTTIYICSVYIRKRKKKKNGEKKKKNRRKVKWVIKAKVNFYVGAAIHTLENCRIQK